MHHQAQAQQPPVDVQVRILHEFNKRVSKRRPAQDHFLKFARKHACSRGHTNRSIRVTNDFGDINALLLALDQHGRHLIEKMAFCIRPKPLDADKALEANGAAVSAAARDLLSGRLTGPDMRRIDVECHYDLLGSSSAGSNNHGHGHSNRSTSGSTTSSTRSTSGSSTSSSTSSHSGGSPNSSPRRTATKTTTAAAAAAPTTSLFAAGQNFEREVTRAFQHPRDDEALLALEAEDPRRRLLAETWAALAHNPAVRELSVDRLVPVQTTALRSAPVRALLGRLEALHVTIYGTKGPGGGHRCINTVPAYIDSLQSVLKVLFAHAAGLRRLSLRASQHAPLGARGHYHIPLSLKATQLPRLQHLELKNCFVGPELAHFINAHAGTLETLRLHNCYSYRGSAAGGGGAGGAGGDGEASSGMSWAAFLAMITRPAAAAGPGAGLRRLRRLDVYDDYIPLEVGDARLRAYDPATADEPEDVRCVRRAQRADPRLRLFLYAFLRDYSGELWMNKDAILASFDAEDDQRAYDALMRVVAANNDNDNGDNGAGDGKSSAVGTRVEVVELPS